MDRNLYFKFLEETSRLIDPILKSVISRYIEKEYDFYQFYSQIVLKRIGQRFLKPTLFRIVYEMYGGGQFEHLTKIAAAFEFINISSYQANCAFDNKLGTITKEEKDAQFISSMVSREIANEFISNAVIDGEVKKTVSDKISLINHNIYLAQHYDLNLLTVDNYPKYEKNEKLFIQNYNNRCYLGSGIFSGVCAYCAALIAGSSEKEAVFVSKISELYGTALHKINDIGDYLPSTSGLNRIYQDCYSDLLNGRLTLPLYLTLKENPDILNEIKNRDNIENNVELVHKNIDKIVHSIKNDFVKIKQLCRKLPNNQERNMFVALLSSLDSNKYYHRLKKTIE